MGREVEVYYQHQMRTSLKIRGEGFINGLFDFFVKEGKEKLPSDCRPEVINGHLKMRRSTEGVTTASDGKAFVPETMDQLA